MRSARRAVGGMVQEKGSRECCRSWTLLYAQCTSALCSGFPISQGNAEALKKWGGKTKHRMISYFLCNTSTKNYRNRIVYVKTRASQMWDVFETRCICLVYVWAFCSSVFLCHRHFLCCCCCIFLHHCNWKNKWFGWFTQIFPFSSSALSECVRCFVVLLW